jgi:hypothetical protein
MKAATMRSAPLANSSPAKEKDVDGDSACKSFHKVLRVQAAYYALTGAWPIIHIASFEAITGPKLERWLVRTLGGTVAAIGASLWTAARGLNPGPETTVLAIGSAAALGTSDAIYALKRRISPIYLADAAVQIALIAALAHSRRATFRSDRRGSPPLDACPRCSHWRCRAANSGTGHPWKYVWPWIPGQRPPIWLATNFARGWAIDFPPIPCSAFCSSQASW